MGPARASVITYINPAIAVTGGVWLLGEPLTAAMVVAFALILGGSVLATRPGQREARRPGQEAGESGAEPASGQPGLTELPPGRRPG